MKKLFLTAALLLFLFTSVVSQNINENIHQRKNSVYLELGGNAGLYSVNYERLFSLSELNRIAVGGGVSFFKFVGNLLSGT